MILAVKLSAAQELLLSIILVFEVTEVNWLSAHCLVKIIHATVVI